MPSQGPNGVGGVSEFQWGSGVTWSIQGNVLSENGNVTSASRALNSGELTTYLLMNGFGFSIPAGSTILGITAEAKIKDGQTFGTSCFDHTILLLDGTGTAVGTNKANVTAWPYASLTWKSWGGSSDVWGWTPSVAHVNSSLFGFTIVAQAFGSAAIPEIDFTRMTVTYALGGNKLKMVL